MERTHREGGKENIMSNSILKRQNRKKVALLEEFKKTPVVQVACQKTGISRATYYRWKKEDEVFSKEADAALEEGSLFVNDIAESQLLSAIKEQNMTAIIFWLKHHHKMYATKVEITTPVKQMEKLDPDQEKLVRKALALASLVPKEGKEAGNGGSQNT